MASNLDDTRSTMPLSKLLLPVVAAALTASAAQAVDLPTMFLPNRGEAPPQVQRVARFNAYQAWLTPSGPVFHFADGRDIAIGLPVSGRFQSEDGSAVPVNFFYGKNRKQWRHDLPAWRRVKAPLAWSGIDAVYYAAPGGLEYDLVVSPGADPSAIRLSIPAETSVELAKSGDLLLRRGANLLRHRKPVAFQTIDGSNVPVDAAYRIASNDRGDAHIAIELGHYDRSEPLIIDPVVEGASYIGGSGRDFVTGMVAAPNGSIYITGQTNTPAISTPNAAQPLLGGANDAFVARLNGSGQVEWLTYFGGGQGSSPRGPDIANSIAIDGAGNVYIGGTTTSDNLSVTENVFQPVNRGGETDAFIVKLAPNGNQVLFATYIGGGSDDWGAAIAVDNQGSVYLTGYTRSTDFPTRNPLQPQLAQARDVFVTKFAADARTLVYSTFLGGVGQDIGLGIAVDATGAAFVTGSTNSGNFPVPNAVQRQLAGGNNEGDAFVAKLNPAGSALVFSTFLGGTNNDQGWQVLVESGGSLLIAGFTASGDFPVRNPFQQSFGGTRDLFVTRMNAAGSEIQFSSFYGGPSEENPGFRPLAVDSSGAIYLAGYTNSPNLIQISPAQTGYGGNPYDGFVARIAPNGSALLYSTFVGGSGDDRVHSIAIDGGNRALIAGLTASANFPGVRGNFGGNNEADAFFARLSADTATAFVSANPTTLNITVPPGGQAAPSIINLTGGGASTTYQVTSSVPWLIVNPPTGNLPAQLSVTVDARSLTAGDYQATLTVASPGTQAPLSIPVTVRIAAVPTIAAIEPNSVPVGSTETTITIRGSGFTQGTTVLINSNPAATTIIDASTLRVIIPAANLASPGNLSLQVRNTEGTSAASTLVVSAGGPTISALGVVSAATNQPGSISPGQVLTLYGAGFGGTGLTQGVINSSSFLETSVGGLRVLIGDVPAPILYTSPSQIGLVVPYEIAGRSSVSLVVEAGGQRSGSVALNVVPAVPGVFTRDNSGGGQATAVNQNGTANSDTNPAAKGSVVTIFGTGEGVTIPASLTGRVSGSDPGSLPVPQLPLEVLVGGVPAQVTYAGAAPGAVAGVLQVNLRIPDGAPSGSAIPIVLRVGGVLSRFDATIAVQ
jgi:uncharacterized protein (TIGR03437 family)